MRVSLGMRGQSRGRSFAKFERFELWRMLAASSDEITSIKQKKDVTLFLSARNSSSLILSAAVSIRSTTGVMIFEYSVWKLKGVEKAERSLCG